MEYVSFGEGWYQTTNATKVLPYSLVNLTPMGSIHASTIGALVGGNRNLSQGWAQLHNLIGGSQQTPQKASTNSTKATMSPRPQNRIGFQEPKRDKLQ